MNHFDFRFFEEQIDVIDSMMKGDFMKRKVQQDLFENVSDFKAGRLSHGGDKAGESSGRKLRRPFDRRRALHVTLKSSSAKGAMSFRSPHLQLKINEIFEREARRNHVKVHRFANVANHFHIVASFPSRESFQCFLRSFSGLVARLVTGARKGKPFGRRFWDTLAHSRVLVGRRSFGYAMAYLEANERQAEEGYEARSEYLARKQRTRKSGEPDFDDVEFD